jgi:hypothetical protein
MSDGSSPRTEIGVALFLIVACAAVLWESRRLPPGVFEPLGSAPIPRATAAIVIALCLIVMAGAVRKLRRAIGGDAAEQPRPPYEPRPLDAAAVLALTCVYIAVMQFRLVGFAVATAAFLFLAVGLLMRFRPRTLPVAAAIGLIMGFGCQYLFTRVFVVDLPAG